MVSILNPFVEAKLTERRYVARLDGHFEMRVLAVEKDVISRRSINNLYSSLKSVAPKDKRYILYEVIFLGFRFDETNIALSTISGRRAFL